MTRSTRNPFALALACAACISAPGVTEAGTQLSAELPIGGILTNPQGGFLLLLNASNPACGSSGNQFNVWVGTFPGAMTSDGAKGALAVAMTAYSLGKPIRVYFDPAISGCPVSQVWIAP